MNILCKTRAFDGGVDVFSAVPIASPKYKLPIRNGCCLECVKGGNEPHMVLRRMFEPRDIQKEMLAQIVVPRHCGFRLIKRSRKKTLMLDAVVHNGDPFMRQPEELSNIACG